jgi:hypothetical protein
MASPARIREALIKVLSAKKANEEVRGTVSNLDRGQSLPVPLTSDAIPDASSALRGARKDAQVVQGEDALQFKQDAGVTPAQSLAVDRELGLPPQSTLGPPKNPARLPDSPTRVTPEEAGFEDINSIRQAEINAESQAATKLTYDEVANQYEAVTGQPALDPGSEQQMMAVIEKTLGDRRGVNPFDAGLDDDIPF